MNNTQWAKLASWFGLGIKDTVGGANVVRKGTKVLELLIETCRGADAFGVRAT